MRHLRVRGSVWNRHWDSSCRRGPIVRYSLPMSRHAPSIASSGVSTVLPLAGTLRMFVETTPLSHAITSILSFTSKCKACANQLLNAFALLYGAEPETGSLPKPLLVTTIADLYSLFSI